MFRHFYTVYNQDISAVAYRLIMDKGKQKQGKTELSSKVIMHIQVN